MGRFEWVCTGVVVSIVLAVVIPNANVCFQRRAERNTMKDLREIAGALRDVLKTGNRLPILDEGRISRLYVRLQNDLPPDLPKYDGWGVEYRCIAKPRGFVLIAYCADRRKDARRSSGTHDSYSADVILFTRGFWSMRSGYCGGGVSREMERLSFDELLDYEFPEPRAVETTGSLTAR